jgi:hypothetical protein
MRTAGIEMFDFKRNWHRVVPHLSQKSVRLALCDGMKTYVAGPYTKMVERGEIPGDLPVAPYNNNIGPWRYSCQPIWDIRAEIEREALRTHVYLPDWLLPGDKLPRVSMLFFPQRRTFQWFQCFGAEEYLKAWQIELGKCLYPSLRWEETHPVACGTNEAGEIKVVLDLVNFEVATPNDLLNPCGLNLLAGHRSLHPRDVNAC